MTKQDLSGFFKMNPLINLFKGNNKEEVLHSQRSNGSKRTDMWSFPAISVNDALSKKTAITDLYDNKTNGYLVKGFMSREEVDHALGNLCRLDLGANGSFAKGAGYSNPKSFSMIADKEKGINEKLLDKYFADIEHYRSELHSIFTFNYEERVLNFFSSIEENIDVQIPVIEVNGTAKQLTTSTVRYCFPNLGGMNTHVGNMFPQIYPLFYSFMDKLMNIDRQISYFVLLSKPEKGGDLVLFDALWGDFVAEEGGRWLVKANGEKILQADLDYQLIAPEPGDMIIFNGGDIWHKVDNLIGKKSRITIGGFLAKNRDNSRIYVWA